MTDHLEEVRLRGRHYGHTARNYQETMGPPDADAVTEATRVAADLYTTEPEREFFISGYEEGWTLRADGLFEDGTPFDDERGS